MDALKKLIDKKKAEKGVLSPNERKAKSSVLEHLMDDMDNMGADKVAGLKKVSVSAPDKSGLEKGLKMASDLVEKGPLHSMDEDEVSDHGDDGNEEEPHDFHNEDGSDAEEEEGAEHEASESPEMESSEHEEKSPEEMDHEELAAHIENLKKLHAAKKPSYGM